MKAFGRSILAVLVGIIVATGLIAGIEAISSTVYPMPDGLDLHDQDAMRRFVESLPVGAFLFVLLAWAVGASAGAWVAARLAGRARLVHGLIVGAFCLAAGILNMVMIPHPSWMWFGGIAALAGCSYLGARSAATTRARAVS